MYLKSKNIPFFEGFAKNICFVRYGFLLCLVKYGEENNSRYYWATILLLEDSQFRQKIGMDLSSVNTLGFSE